MKKLITAVVALFVSAMAFAQSEGPIGWAVGLTGGFTTTSLSTGTPDKLAYPMFNAGVSFKIPLPAHFSLQPAIMYNGKGLKYKMATAINMEEGLPDEGLEVIKKDKLDFVEIPIYLQWGPDLFLFRPYIEVGPYVGYGFLTRQDEQIAGGDWMNLSKKDWSEVNRWEYGVSVGGGLEIWRIQIGVRYAWDFMKTYKVEDNNTKMGSLMVSATYFF